MVFGLPFPTYLGWHATVITLVVMTGISVYFYMRFAKEEEDEKDGK